DAAGNAYVTGVTTSSNFPTVGAYQPVNKGGSGDVFVSKLDASGSGLVYSTYLGGSGADESFNIAVDATGSAYVTGDTASTDFPVVPASPLGNAGGLDAFVTKLSPAGSALVYSTYIGGTGDDGGTGVRVDAAGNAFVSGFTSSTNFPTHAPIQAASGGGTDAFVVKLAPAGTSFVYATYIGGAGEDLGQRLAIDPAGSAYLPGRPTSSNVPSLSALQPVFAGGSTLGDGFVTKINPAGSALVYSTFLGGTGDDQANGIVVDGAGNATVAGETRSTNFPTVAALQT